VSAVILLGWAVGAFFGLGLGCYSLTALLKPWIRALYEDRHGDLFDDPTSKPRRRYRGLVRSIPNLLGLVMGGARWALELAGYSGAEHFRLWPVGLMPLAGPVLGAGAGGLALIIHEAVASSMPAAVRALWSAVATRGAGQRIDLEATITTGEPPARSEMVSTMEFDPLPPKAEGTLEP